MPLSRSVPLVVPAAAVKVTLLALQMKVIDRSIRHNYAELVLALAADHRDAVLEKYIGIGIKTRDMNREILWSLARFWNDTDGENVTGKMCVACCTVCSFAFVVVYRGCRHARLSIFLSLSPSLRCRSSPPIAGTSR